MNNTQKFYLSCRLNNITEINRVLAENPAWLWRRSFGKNVFERGMIDAMQLGNTATVEALLRVPIEQKMVHYFFDYLVGKLIDYGWLSSLATASSSAQNNIDICRLLLERMDWQFYQHALNYLVGGGKRNLQAVSPFALNTIEQQWISVQEQRLHDNLTDMLADSGSSKHRKKI